MHATKAFTIGLLLALSAAADAAREPVLKQIQLPHNYYFREMYLPQLTTGPSAVSFSPDGSELVYSMGGSLWRQRIGSDEARELTHGPGYDYQPDWSRDGRHLVFSRYQGDAVELWQLDMKTGRAIALTNSGAVSLEPRYSPDGGRLAFVSTKESGHFDLFIADLHGDRMSAPQRIAGSRKSAVPRYYYSPFDHAINPSWTPDGRSIVFVSNREVAYGTGDLYVLAVDETTEPRKLLSEETTWRAQPQVAPDGRRILFSSYHGRQWQQLWMTTIDGAAPLPLTFGDFDRVQARFSPDGTRIAYVSNESGNTSLWVQELVGGARVEVRARQRRYLGTHGLLRIAVRDESGKTVPARIAIIGSDGRAHAPVDAWLQADDGFDRSVQATETHYFHCPGECSVDLPVGAARLTVTRGLGYRAEQRSVTVPAAGTDIDVPLSQLRLPEHYGHWAAADLHVHMNYGGHYRNDVGRLIGQARAEGLDAVYNLIVNKEQRIPDIDSFTPAVRNEGGVLAIQSQEFHTSFWGHLGLLGLDDHFLAPDFSGYRDTALASVYPHNGVVADLAHKQHALVGYAHPFDEPVDPEKDAVLSNQFPADVAHGKVDYYEVMGFSDHKSTASVWYRLLNLGFRIPAGAGTDAMANYASLRGPVGMNRVFIDTAGELTPTALLDGIRRGRTFVSNGPLLGLEVAGKHPGDELSLTSPGRVDYRIALRSLVPVDHLELVHNGRVVATHTLAGARTELDASGSIDIGESGWLLLRGWNDEAHPLVLDLYPYASTSPVYVSVAGAPPRAPADAHYFVRWLDRVIEAAAARKDYNSDSERQATLDYLDAARAIFKARE